MDIVKYSHIDRYYRQNDAGQCHCCELVDKFHAHEHNESFTLTFSGKYIKKFILFMWLLTFTYP